MQRLCSFVIACGFAAALGAFAEDAEGLVIRRPAAKSTQPDTSGVAIKRMDVAVEIDGLAARTRVTHVFENTTDNALPVEGIYTFPLPPGAAADFFAMTVQSETELAPGTLLVKNSALDIFNDITEHRGSYIARGSESTGKFMGSRSGQAGSASDPGLLESLGAGLFRAQFFPIEKHRTKSIVVSCLQPLEVQRQTSGTAVLVYRFPLGPAKNYLESAGVVHLTARLHGNPGASVSSSINTVKSTDASGETLLDATLPASEFQGGTWEISVALPSTDVRSSECIVLANHSDLREADVFALTLSPLELSTAAIKGARISVTLPGGRKADLCGASVSDLERGHGLTIFGSCLQHGLATIVLQGTIDGAPFSRYWTFNLPEKASANEVAAKFYSVARSQELSAQGHSLDAALLAGKNGIVALDAAFLILDTDKRYRKYHVVRAINNDKENGAGRCLSTFTEAGTAVPVPTTEEGEVEIGLAR